MRSEIGPLLFDNKRQTKTAELGVGIKRTLFWFEGSLSRKWVIENRP